MRNYVQPGDVITLPCPLGGRSSGDGVQVGDIFGVATADAEAGADLEVKLSGVFDMEKVSAQAWAIGDPIFYDDGADKCTTNGSGNILIGVAVAVAANPSDFGRVRLNGAFTIAPAT